MADMPLDDEIVELREFICRCCGHTVVVRPDLPKDYTPTICTPCYDNIELPRQGLAAREIFAKAQELFRLCGLDNEPTASDGGIDDPQRG